jgi:hypothetical protein
MEYLAEAMDAVDEVFLTEIEENAQRGVPAVRMAAAKVLIRWNRPLGIHVVSWLLEHDRVSQDNRRACLECVRDASPTILETEIPKLLRLPASRAVTLGGLQLKVDLRWLHNKPHLIDCLLDAFASLSIHGSQYADLLKILFRLMPQAVPHVEAAVVRGPKRVSTAALQVLSKAGRGSGVI